MVNILADLCLDAAGYKIFGFLGVIINIIKIVVPIIIVVMGSIDLVKAVMAQKEDEIKKGYIILLKRIIVGVVIFFIPGIVTMIMTLAGNDTSKCDSAKCALQDSSNCISKGNDMARKQNMLNTKGFYADLNCEGGLVLTEMPSFESMKSSGLSKEEYDTQSVLGTNGNRYICGFDLGGY